MEIKKTKLCKCCNEIKEVKEFNKNSNTKDRLQSYCRQCQKEKNKTWEKENRKKRNEYKRNYNLVEKNKISYNLRNRLNHALRRFTGTKKVDDVGEVIGAGIPTLKPKSSKTLQLIDCSLEHLITWLNFTKKYYVPENYEGQIDIEHMIEFGRLDLKDQENHYKVMSWRNIRYMTHEENNRKRNKKLKFKYVAKQIYLLICFEKGKTPIIDYCRIY